MAIEMTQAVFVRTSPLGPAPRDPVERFWESVDRRAPDECWLWTGNIDEFLRVRRIR